MIRNVSLIFFLMFTVLLFSQKVILSGAVNDSLQNPLPYANVISKPKDVSKNLQFATTDNDGYYKLILEKGDSITINISYLGYKPINYSFIALKTARKDFILQQSSEQLKEVIIEMPIIIKGDTTTFRTEKFITGTERKLKNVLKQLPGVEVSKSGRVTVQGKKVTHMLVDGKKFFGGNSKLAVENIPANAVGNVQVIDNYNEVAFLKDLTDSDDMAMNIQLKEDKKRFVFGDIEASKGNKDFYKLSANLFYYSPKTNINFIGNLNNIGEKTFTFKDYLSFSGGVNAVFKDDFNWKGGNFTQFLEKKEVVKSQQKFAALNISKTTSSSLDVAGYAIFSNSNTNSFVENTNQYTSFIEQKTNATHVDNLLGIANLNIDYTPSSIEKWYVRTQLKRTDNKNDNNLSSLIETTTNTIATNRKLIETYINQNIEWHKSLTDKHTFSSVLSYVYNKSNRKSFWTTQDAIPVDNNQDVLRIHQLKNSKEQNINLVFKHFWELNNNNHIYTTLANKFLSEDFLTDDKQLLDNGAINNFYSSGFGNTMNFKLNEFFFGVHYKFRSGIFTVKQGVYLKNYNWGVYNQENIKSNKWVVLPDFSAKIKFNKSRKLELDYKLKTSFSDASKLANRFYLQSYNSVFKGNENLENNLYHSARIFYNRFSLYRGLIIFASLNYNKQIRGYRNTVDFNDVNQFLTVKMFDNPSEDIHGNIFLEKKIKSIKYKFEIGFDNSKYIQEVNNTVLTNTSKNYNYEIGIETFFDNFPTIALGLKSKIGKFVSSSSISKFVTIEPFITIDYDFLNGFNFNFDYQRNNYQNKTFGQKNIYEIANTSVSYKKENSAWTYSITAQNLFNAKFKQSNHFSDYLISDTKTFILPRIVMFSVGYNL